MTVPVDCTGGLSTSKELQGFSTSCPSFLLYFPNHYLSSENALISLFIPACFFGMSVLPKSNHSEGLRSTEQIFCLSGWEHWTPSCSSFKSFGTASICFLKLQEYFTVESLQGIWGPSLTFWTSFLPLKSLWLYVSPLWKQILYIEESPNLCPSTSPRGTSPCT